MNNEEAQKMFDLAQTLKETGAAMEREVLGKLIVNFPWQEFDWKAVQMGKEQYDIQGTPRSKRATQIMNFLAEQRELGQLQLMYQSDHKRIEWTACRSFDGLKHWVQSHSVIVDFSAIEEVFAKKVTEAQAELDEWKNLVASHIQEGATPHNKVPWQDVLEGKEEAPIHIDLRKSSLYTSRSLTKGDYVYARQGDAWGYDRPTAHNDDSYALTYVQKSLAVLYKYLGDGIAQLVRPEQEQDAS